MLKLILEMQIAEVCCLDQGKLLVRRILQEALLTLSLSITDTQAHKVAFIYLYKIPPKHNTTFI
jgi:hypothetical protein